MDYTKFYFLLFEKGKINYNRDGNEFPYDYICKFNSFLQRKLT